MSDHGEIIDQLIDFISHSQNKDGSFCYESSHDNFKTYTHRTAVFYNTLISQSLLKYKDDARIRALLQKNTQWLLKQKTDSWTFNYWDRKSDDYQKHPLPDDLDDTCCALATLYMFEPKKIKGDVLAKITHTLIHQEIKTGGPYKTWITHQHKHPWNNVDIGVNANVGFFLNLLGIDLTGVDKYIEKTIQTELFESDFYLSSLSIIYLLSRWHVSKNKDQLLRHIYKLISSKKISAIDLLFGIKALMNYGVADSNLIKKLLTHVELGTVYKSSPICIDIVDKHKKYLAGSSVLSAALAVDILKTYTKQKERPKQSLVLSGGSMNLKILKSLQEKVKHTPANIQPHINRIMSSIAENDKHNIISLTPYYFYASINVKHPLSEELLLKLGLANMYGWAAYTIYDDFFDNEGNVLKLSSANILLRELVCTYESLFIEYPSFRNEFHKILDVIDSANQREVEHYRFSENNISLKKYLSYHVDLTISGEKSIGHALGPLFITYIQEASLESTNYKNIYKIFLLYLSIRQITDDMHDWLDDLHKGIINDVTIQIFHDTYRKGYKNITVLKDDNKLMKIFWTTSIVTICKKIMSHHQEGVKLLNNIGLIKNPTYLLKQFDHYKNIAESTLDEQQSAIEFLKSY